MGVYLYSIGLFFTLFFLFAKFFPVINIAEMKSILKTDSEKLPPKKKTEADTLQSASYGTLNK
jgi:molybdopterin-containing oxidoreductase family membrane subunit